MAKNHGVPREVFKQYISSEVEENEACWSLPFTLLLVLSYASFAILHDGPEFVRAVEDSIEHEIVENANFAYTGESPTQTDTPGLLKLVRI